MQKKGADGKIQETLRKVHHGNCLLQLSWKNYEMKWYHMYLHSKFKYVETQTDLTEIIDNHNKRIYKLEQEIDELTCQLQVTQQRNDIPYKGLFTFENLKECYFSFCLPNLGCFCACFRVL